MTPCPNCKDIERRMRNKMQALEVQNKQSSWPSETLPSGSAY